MHAGKQQTMAQYLVGATMWDIWIMEFLTLAVLILTRVGIWGVLLFLSNKINLKS